MEKLIIRPMRFADGHTVKRMIHALASHHGDVATATDQDIQRLCFGHSPVMRVLVAERADILLGYAGFMVHAQLHTGKTWCDLHHLFVSPDSRGEGVGQALIKVVSDAATGLGCVSVVVGTHQDNRIAQGFYRFLGFDERPPQGCRFRRDIDRSLEAGL